MNERILWDTIEEQRVCIERLRGEVLAANAAIEAMAVALGKERTANQPAVAPDWNTPFDAADRARKAREDAEFEEGLRRQAEYMKSPEFKAIVDKATSDPTPQPPVVVGAKLYRLEDKFDNYRFTDFDARMWNLIVVPADPTTTALCRHGRSEHRYCEWCAIPTDDAP